MRTPNMSFEDKQGLYDCFENIFELQSVLQWWEKKEKWLRGGF